MRITNSVTGKDYLKFFNYSIELFNKNLTEMYLQGLNNLYSKPDSRGIGLIVLKKDYDVNLCIRFHRNENEYLVTVYVEF